MKTGLVNGMTTYCSAIRVTLLQPRSASAVYWAALLLVCCLACSSGPKVRPDASASAPLPPGAQPQRLIATYADMRETDTISWLWSRPGFKKGVCRSFQVHPVQNLSQVNNPEAQRAVEEALHETLAKAKESVGGGLDISVTAAIVEMRSEPSIIKKFFRSFSDYPYIEVEIVMHEEPSKAILLKLCHYSKADEFKTVVAAMVKDLKTFFEQEF
jgi:hypothetical protein